MTTLKARLAGATLSRIGVTRRTFDIVRTELRSRRTTLGNAISPRYKRAVAALAERRNLSINLSSGGKGKPDWINTELIPAQDTTICLDIRRELPFADGSADRVLAEHVVEHLDFKEDIPRLFDEVFRVLSPGGTFRVIVPDCEAFLKAYASGDTTAWRDLGWPLETLPDDIFTPMHVINHMFHQDGEHLFGYDFQTLEWLLRKAGFARVEKQAFGQSVDSELAIDQANHQPYSLYVDAVK